MQYSIEATIGTQLAVLYKEVSLLRGRFVHSSICGCCRQYPHSRGVPYSERPLLRGSSVVGVPPPSGVGCSEMLMANAVQDLAAQTPGKESIAIEAFARALRMVRGERESLCDGGGGGLV